MQYATGYHLGPVTPPGADGASLKKKLNSLTCRIHIHLSTFNAKERYICVHLADSGAKRHLSYKNRIIAVIIDLFVVLA